MHTAAQSGDEKSPLDFVPKHQPSRGLGRLGSRGKDTRKAHRRVSRDQERRWVQAGEESLQESADDAVDNGAHAHVVGIHVEPVHNGGTSDLSREVGSHVCEQHCHNVQHNALHITASLSCSSYSRYTGSFEMELSLLGLT